MRVRAHPKVRRRGIDGEPSPFHGVIKFEPRMPIVSALPLIPAVDEFHGDVKISQCLAKYGCERSARHHATLDYFRQRSETGIGKRFCFVALITVDPEQHHPQAQKDSCYIGTAGDIFDFVPKRRWDFFLAPPAIERRIFQKPIIVEGDENKRIFFC
jgi:hypothetical protein